MSETKKNKKNRTGTVVSNRMDKSIVVRVERKVRHKLYGKYIKQSVKYLADDPESKCNIGDIVQIEECRPLSKKKRWRLRDIIREAV
ncbi:MAG: 30S ribosomal protein S17 [Desulfocapsa sp.]|nr:30S ribosomal protein S17 [Desulfocapsa sp.]